MTQGFPRTSPLDDDAWIDEEFDGHGGDMNNEDRANLAVIALTAFEGRQGDPEDKPRLAH